MNPPSDPSPPWLIPLIVAGFPLVFIPMWCGVCFLLSRIGGWSRLAEKYPGSATPTGAGFAGQVGRMGGVNYKAILTIHTSPDGLHLSVMKLFRVGHPPILIPWTEIHHAKLRRFFWSESVVFEAGSPRLAKVRLPKKIFAGTPVVIDGERESAAPPPLPKA